ncbi:hypothetical protein SK128_012481 [Halocaridina rubra]|uniref:Uncharacterized protein n=1 Tax=Halocaridina rubra TaxID=373956 RepID=A0AAN8XJT0_HALRR
MVVVQTIPEGRLAEAEKPGSGYKYSERSNKLMSVENYRKNSVQKEFPTTGYDPARAMDVTWTPFMSRMPILSCIGKVPQSPSPPSMPRNLEVSEMNVTPPSNGYEYEAMDSYSRSQYEGDTQYMSIPSYPTPPDSLSRYGPVPEQSYTAEPDPLVQKHVLNPLADEFVPKQGLTSEDVNYLHPVKNLATEVNSVQPEAVGESESFEQGIRIVDSPKFDTTRNYQSEVKSKRSYEYYSRLDASVLSYNPYENSSASTIQVKTRKKKRKTICGFCFRNRDPGDYKHPLKIEGALILIARDTLFDDENDRLRCHAF